MAVMKDFRCEDCFSVVEEMVPGNVTSRLLWCSRCGKERRFHSVCNGGKKHCKILSYGTEWDKHIQFGEAKIGTIDEVTGEFTPDVHKSGKLVQEVSKGNNEDVRAKYRDEIKHKYRKLRGHEKIFIDGGKK